MVTCEEELSDLDKDLIFEYTGEINIEKLSDENDDAYLKITESDTVNLNNILKTVQNDLKEYSYESEYTYISKIENNQLFVKILDEDIDDEETDWIVV